MSDLNGIEQLVTKKRVLFWSIYARWLYHVKLEGVWANALKLSGADVRFILCDGCFKSCDVYRDRINPRHSRSCMDCQADSFQYANQLRVEWEALGGYIPRPVRFEAQAWIEAMPKEDLLQATWKDRPVGHWALSSILYQYRLYELDLDDPKVVQTARDTIVGVVLALEGGRVLFDEFMPEVVIVLNGRFFAHRVMLELCKERNVRYITHERGTQDNTFRIVDEDITHTLHDFRKVWRMWKDVPLKRHELARVKYILEQRRVGRNTNWTPFSPPPTDGALVRADLNLDERPVVAIFTSSDDEMAGMPEWAVGAFPRSFDWLPATIELARRRTDLQFVFRIHPNLAQMGGNLTALANVEALLPTMPANCRMVMPTDKVSSYTLGDVAACNIVYCSTIGLELATRGAPLVAVAIGQYGMADFVILCDKPERYEACIDEALSRGPNLEVARAALRNAYHRFETMSIHLGIRVEQKNMRGSDYVISWPKYAQDYRDNGLQVITDLVLTNKSHIPVPTEADGAYGTHDEDVFLRNYLTSLYSNDATVKDVISQSEALHNAGDIMGAMDPLIKFLDQDRTIVRVWLQLAELLTDVDTRAQCKAWTTCLNIDPTCRPARIGLLDEATHRKDSATVSYHLGEMLTFSPLDPALSKYQAWLSDHVQASSSASPTQ